MVEERITRRRLLPALGVRQAFLAVYLGSCGPVAAQEKVAELKLSTWLPPAHALTETFEAWAQSVERVSKGTLKFRIFSAQALGKAQDHFDMARNGTIDAALFNPLFQQGRLPVLEAGALPLLLANAKGGTAALDEWYRGLAEKEMREVRFCLAFVREPGTFHSKRRIAAPSELRSKKVLTPNAVIANFVSSLGGTSVQYPVAEARQILERGGADTVVLPWGSVAQFRVEQSAKFHLDIPMYTTPLAMVLNRTSYGRLSDQQREAIEAHCNGEWALKFADQWSNRDAPARALLATQTGHEIFRPAPAQMEQWLKAGITATQQWSGQVRKAGWNSVELLNGLRAALTRHGGAVH